MRWPIHPDRRALDRCATGLDLSQGKFLAGQIFAAFSHHPLSELFNLVENPVLHSFALGVLGCNRWI